MFWFHCTRTKEIETTTERGWISPSHIRYSAMAQINQLAQKIPPHICSCYERYVREKARDEPFEWTAGKRKHATDWFERASKVSKQRTLPCRSSEALFQKQSKSTRSRLVVESLELKLKWFKKQVRLQRISKRFSNLSVVVLCLFFALKRSTTHKKRPTWSVFAYNPFWIGSTLFGIRYKKLISFALPGPIPFTPVIIVNVNDNTC